MLADTFAEAKAKTLVNMLVDMTSKAVLNTLAASLLEAKAVTLPHWGVERETHLPRPWLTQQERREPRQLALGDVKAEALETQWPKR